MQRITRRPFYHEYAWAYDLLMTPPLARQCDFIVERLARRGIAPGRSILDAGCGVGGYAIELARRGYVVTGLDLSEQLIAEAQQRAGQAGFPVAFGTGDVLTLAPTPRYDGVLCRGVLNDLLDEASRQEVFYAFARALSPGGVLILDVREWYATARRKTRQPIFERTVNTAGGRLTFRSVTRLDHRIRRLLVAERHVLRKDDVETVSIFDFSMRCWTHGGLHRYLTRAGFERIEYYGAYDGMVPVGASDRLVSVASRPPKVDPPG